MRPKLTKPYTRRIRDIDIVVALNVGIVDDRAGGHDNEKPGLQARDECTTIMTQRNDIPSPVTHPNLQAKTCGTERTMSDGCK